jgi:predicted metal-dependent phosphoesterase TrpH
LRLDLHLHTTASDGSLSPSALVWAARSGGLDVIAIADHDTCAGVEDARKALPNDVHVVPAVELSTTYEGCELHILGYFIDHTHASMKRYSEEAELKRRQRIAGMLEKLKPYGVKLTLEDVLKAADSGTHMIGRPHLARALAQRGYVQTVSEAFDRFIGDSGPAFLPTQLLSPKQGIDLIHEVGGVAVWAHPRASALEKHLTTLAEYGLDGVECYRPNASPTEVAVVEQHARSKSLLVTGGSDWHGSWQGRLGDFYIGPDEVEALLEVGGM